MRLDITLKLNLLCVTTRNYAYQFCNFSDAYKMAVAISRMSRKKKAFVGIIPPKAFQSNRR